VRGGLTAGVLRGAAVLCLVFLALACRPPGKTGPGVADPNVRDRPGGDALGTRAADIKRPAGPGETVEPAPAGVSVVVTLSAFTLPAGTIDGRDEIWAKVDEDRPGIARKTLLRRNGLRAGAVAAADLEFVAAELARGALNRAGIPARAMPDRTPVNIGLRRSHDVRQTLFLHGLDGALTARQYHTPVGSLLVTPAVEPTEPDRIYLDALPVLEFRTDAEIGGPTTGGAPIRDLTLKELLEMLPSGAVARGGLRAGSGREELFTMRFRVKVAAGGALLIAPRKDAVDEPGLGRFLLVDGPKDVGIETVLLIGVNVRNGRLGG
jgi:hypothetical protein